MWNTSTVDIDEWFRRIRQQYPRQMRCGKGCTACCYGLFDISLADAVDVARGFEKLPPDVQQRVRSRAVDLHSMIRERTFSEDDPRIDQIVDNANSPACPCLGDAGECLIYEHRPLACRLEGVPMVDVNEGLFGDWCELNFVEGVPDGAMRDLKLDYNRIDASEEARSAAVARQAGLSDPRAVTFIPSVIAEFDRFWNSLALKR
jgi:Fe-S-cluster containining protein